MVYSHCMPFIYIYLSLSELYHHEVLLSTCLPYIVYVHICPLYSLKLYSHEHHRESHENPLSLVSGISLNIKKNKMTK